MMNKEEVINQVINISDDYDRALELVKILFLDRIDREGEPYLGHLLRVSGKLENSKTKIAGLLHDTVEDTEFTLDDLRKLNFDEEILDLVDLVTIYDKDSNYHDKITSIIESGNIEAVKLKYSDMSDNFSEKRLALLDEETRNRLINKYKDEIIRLEEKIRKEEEIC